MRPIRRHSRAEIGGMAARVEWASQSDSLSYPVLNVSEGGMLVQGLDVAIGVPVSFLLVGNGIEYGGRGHVAHRTGGAAGIAVDEWDAPPDKLKALVLAELLAKSTWRELYVADWR